MAPEVVQEKEYNESCDLWSAGVVLFLLLSGKPPFYSEDREATIKLIKKGKVEFTSMIKQFLRIIGPRWGKISLEAKSFLLKLLQYEPEKRITAAEALTDGWIAKYNKRKSSGTEDAIQDSINNLRAFHTQMTLQKAVLAYIASQELSKSEEEKIKNAFECLDLDKNGLISKEELVKGSQLLHRTKYSSPKKWIA